MPFRTTIVLVLALAAPHDADLTDPVHGVPDHHSSSDFGIALAPGIGFPKPPLVTALRTTSGSTGDLLLIEGKHFAPAINVSIAQGGIGIVEWSDSKRISARLEGAATPSSGTVLVTNGKRVTVQASAFGSSTGAPAIPGVSVFSGKPTIAYVTPDAPQFSLEASPSLTAFQQVAWDGPGARYRLALDGWQPGDELRFWLRLEANGRLHDAYWVDPGGPAGPGSATVTSAMTPQWSAIWSSLWLQLALEDHIPGITCDVQDGALLLSVSSGTGITHLSGGYVEG